MPLRRCSVIKEHLRYPGYFEPTTMFDHPIPSFGIWQFGKYPHIGDDGKMVEMTELDRSSKEAPVASNRLWETAGDVESTSPDMARLRRPGVLSVISL